MMAKVDEFIRTRGVTKCPGAFTPELAALHAQREREFREMTPAQKRKKHSDRHWYRKKVGKNGT